MSRTFALRLRPSIVISLRCPTGRLGAPALDRGRELLVRFGVFLDAHAFLVGLDGLAEPARAGFRAERVAVHAAARRRAELVVARGVPDDLEHTRVHAARRDGDRLLDP